MTVKETKRCASCVEEGKKFEHVRLESKARKYGWIRSVGASRVKCRKDLFACTTTAVSREKNATPCHGDHNFNPEAASCGWR